jgi:hypothetical protein
MLNPPLAKLPPELLALIVEQLASRAEDPRAENLKRLSVVDRAFTLLCQSHLFKDLNLSGDKAKMTRTMENAYAILERKVSSGISFVRQIRLDLDRQKDPSWLFQDQTFLSLMGVLSKAPRPPYELDIMNWNAKKTEDPHLIIQGLANSFFSKSLEGLHLYRCRIPVNLLRVSPALKRLEILDVNIITPSKNGRDDTAQFDKTQLPKLRVLDHRLSFDLVQRFLPAEGRKQVADLSQLRTLHMCPEDEENMTLAQPILDVACKTLEEIHLEHYYILPDDFSCKSP